MLIQLLAHAFIGGDADHFAEMAAAYKSLLSIQDQQEKFNGCNVIEYELVLVKGDKGMGFSVVEDKLKHGVYVSDVHDNINVVGMTIEAEGEIRIHDRIIGIDKDETSEWPISRVRARLNATRVKKGQQVTFVMERPVVDENGNGNGNDRANKSSDSCKTKKENETPNRTGSDPFSSTAASAAAPPPLDPFSPLSSPSYQHHYQGGMSPDPRTPLSSSSSFKEYNWQPNEREALNEEIKHLKDQLEIAHAKVEESAQCKSDCETKGLDKDKDKEVNKVDKLKKAELGKVLLHCQRSLSMYIDSRSSDDVDNRLLEIQKFQGTALELLAFTDRELSEYINEQETNEKLHQRIEEIEALVINTMKGAQDK